MRRRPALLLLTKARVRRQAIADGATEDEADRLEKRVGWDVMDAAETESKFTGMKAIGDGTLIRKILDLLNSEQAQAFIKMILLLLGFLGPAETADAVDAPPLAPFVDLPSESGVVAG